MVKVLTAQLKIPQNGPLTALCWAKPVCINSGVCKFQSRLSTRHTPPASPVYLTTTQCCTLRPADGITTRRKIRVSEFDFLRFAWSCLCATWYCPVLHGTAVRLRGQEQPPLKRTADWPSDRGDQEQGCQGLAPPVAASQGVPPAAPQRQHAGGGVQRLMLLRGHRGPAAS